MIIFESKSSNERDFNEILSQVTGVASMTWDFDNNFSNDSHQDGISFNFGKEYEGIGIEIGIHLIPANHRTTDTNDGFVEDVFNLSKANIQFPLPYNQHATVGQFDNPISYESYDRSLNNFNTLSDGYALTPTTFRGMMLDVRTLKDMKTKTGVIYDTPTFNSFPDTNFQNEFGSFVFNNFTGSQNTMYSGLEFDSGVLKYMNRGVMLSTYVLRLNSAFIERTFKIKNLEFEYASNSIFNNNNSSGQNKDFIRQVTAKYKMKDDMKIKMRYEWGESEGVALTAQKGIETFTIGLEKEIWPNIISRVEFQHADDATKQPETQTYISNTLKF
ncbi:hypothetical protein CPAV1605_42 [seawater metagenome]|uniref:Uncharacterized protein n=1 Tax=seawater metagenome TaxID=1561972 RepID=A0A5E8CLP2_9ZZZZ